jgi:hypothetical protein
LPLLLGYQNGAVSILVLPFVPVFQDLLKKRGSTTVEILLAECQASVLLNLLLLDSSRAQVPSTIRQIAFPKVVPSLNFSPMSGTIFAHNNKHCQAMGVVLCPKTREDQLSKMGTNWPIQCRATAGTPT